MTWHRLMLYCNQAGINYTEFYDNTIAENFRIVTAHRLNEYNADVRARMVMYGALLPYRNEDVELDLYELWPLQFDPSKEERDRLNKVRQEKENEGLRQLLESIERK